MAWDGNYYAVPYDHVTDILPLRVTQKELFVYAPDLHLLARHELAPRSAGAKLDPQGFHRRWHKTAVVDIDQLRQTFEDIGEEALGFFLLLESALGRQARHHARQILLLRERYATSDLVRAFRHARDYGAYDHHSIARILAARAAPRRLAEYVAEETAERLGRLGPDATCPRDLDEYDRLPVMSSLAKEPACQSESDPQDQTSSSNACSDTSRSSD